MLKTIIGCALVLLMAWQPKPPTFEQAFSAYETALFNYLVATGTNGDTTTTKAALITTRAALSGWNVQAELEKRPPLQQGCRWACAGQFYYYCLNLSGSSYEIKLCIDEYEGCLRNCGYIPF